MVVTAEPLAVSVGPRVKVLREAMDLSLRDLAERSGVSAPMLSQVERGETSPTLQVAARIAAGLELRLSQLLRLDEDGTVTVVRRDERRPPGPPPGPPPASSGGSAGCCGPRGPAPPPPGGATGAAAAAPTATATRSSRRRCPASARRSPATRSRPAPAPAVPAIRPCT